MASLSRLAGVCPSLGYEDPRRDSRTPVNLRVQCIPLHTLTYANMFRIVRSICQVSQPSRNIGCQPQLLRCFVGLCRTVEQCFSRHYKMADAVRTERYVRLQRCGRNPIGAFGSVSYSCVFNCAFFKPSITWQAVTIGGSTVLHKWLG